MIETKTIAVRLIPKASSNRIGNMRLLPNGEERLIIYVTAIPDQNQANNAMLRLLAKYLKVPQSHLAIIQGH
ncbi:MAG: DUF167 domain-containing protein [Alphaproteobacteria bacterium]|nr:DUF167 domain-containing protein [Alphaproteobacteria bacterium]